MLPGLKGSKIKYTSYTEDSLTSSVFQLLFYLPSEMLKGILSDTLSANSYAVDFTDLQRYEFWPKWDPAGTNNERYIEPDLVLYFQDLVVIVEAKRYNYGGQYLGQWSNEVRAYYNENDGEATNVILWALGGIVSLETGSVEIDGKRVVVVKSTWGMLLQAIKKRCDEQLKQREIPGVDRNFELLRDLIYTFKVHGFFVGKWIVDKGFERPLFSNPRLDYFAAQNTNFVFEKVGYDQ